MRDSLATAIHLGFTSLVVAKRLQRAEEQANLARHYLVVVEKRSQKDAVQDKLDLLR